MRRHLAFLGRDALVYGLAGGLTRFVKVLLVPIVARAFPVETFGVFDSLSVHIFVLAMIGVLGLDSAVIVAARQDAAAGKQRAMAGGMTLVLAASSLLGVALVAGARFWSRLLLDSADFAPVVVWAGISVPFSALLIYFLSLLKWEFRRRWYLAASLGSAFASVLLTWVVAFQTDFGLVGLFAASLAGQVFGAAIAGWGCRDLLAITWDRPVIRRMVAIGIPFALIGVMSTLAPSIDRFFLVKAHTLADAGVYGFGQKVASLSALVLAGFQTAWGPFAFSMDDARRKAAVFGRVFLLVLAFGVYAAFLLALAAPWLAEAIGRAEYRAAAAVAAPLGLSVALGAMFFIVSIGAFLEGRTLLTLVAYGAGVVTALALNLAFSASALPPESIAWANCSGQLISVIFMAWLSHRVHPVPYPWLRGAALFAAAAVALAWAGSVGTRLGIVEGAALMLAGGTALLAWAWFVMLEEPERRAIHRRIARS
jgi:O-antigen/teichoic acid export membrane protein